MFFLSTAVFLLLPAKWQPITLNEGDSIYKKPDTFKVTIFRKRYDNPIIIVEDTVDCDKLK